MSLEYSLLRQTASIPRVVKAPPISGQSASTKHSTPWTGASVPTISRTTLTCLSTPSTSFVQSRPPTTSFSTRGRMGPPSILSFGATLVLLGVDHEDTRPRDGEVVDIGPAPGDASVVQHTERVIGEFVQPRAEPLFAKAPVSQAVSTAGHRSGRG